MEHRILDMISSPADLKLLTDEELGILASEIREQILLTTSKNGGHVAPSLGVVELTLACHSLLDCPHDKLLFDVGHQSYAHKLLTGRLGIFDTLRQYKGMFSQGRRKSLRRASFGPCVRFSVGGARSCHGARLARWR